MKTLKFLLLTLLIVSCTSKPKRLVEIIADSMKENPKDWVLTEVKDIPKDSTIIESYVHVMNESWNSSNQILENKKICVKIKLTNYGYRLQCATLILPDSLSFSDKELQIIINAYDEAINKPIRVRGEEISDSINEIENKKTLDKEIQIINKLCKQ